MSGLKKSTIIKNLLQREDNKYLAVRNVKGDGVEFYFESKENVGKATNKEILNCLSKEELESLLFNKQILHVKNLNVKNFELDSYKPEIKKKRFSTVVKRDYIDKLPESFNSSAHDVKNVKGVEVRKIIKKVK